MEMEQERDLVCESLCENLTAVHTSHPTEKKRVRGSHDWLKVSMPACFLCFALQV